MVKVVAVLGVVMMVEMLSAAEVKDKAVMKLWPASAPGQVGDKPGDVPTMQVFLPEDGKGTGAAIVVCPGGGYGGLANHEGPVVGEFLAKHGVAAFVLKYRLGPKYHHPVELGDAQRAIRTVRANAAEWKIDPKRIGIMGFSAGGHLASTAATHFDNGDAKAEDPIEWVSCRPDAQTLIYPVVTMGQGTHGGSKNNLLGKDPKAELVELLSNEKQVTKETPVAFVVHSTVDSAVPVSNSDNYVAALKGNGVAYEYVRLEPDGEKLPAKALGHGFGLRDFWTPQWVKWLQSIHFAAKE